MFFRKYTLQESIDDAHGVICRQAPFPEPDEAAQATMYPFVFAPRDPKAAHIAIFSGWRLWPVSLEHADGCLLVRIALVRPGREDRAAFNKFVSERTRFPFVESDAAFLQYVAEGIAFAAYDFGPYRTLVFAPDYLAASPHDVSASARATMQSCWIPGGSVLLADSGTIDPALVVSNG